MSFFLLPLLLLAVGLGVLWWSRRLQTRTGLPAGEVVYSDTGAWERVEAPLVSRRFGLVGKPDYLVRVTEGGRQITVPVEVKSRAQPAAPLDSHLLQLAAYCLLVEDLHGGRPPYGLLRYADATLKVPFTDELRQQTLKTADELRRARRAADLRRQHDDAWRCQGCGYLDACGDGAVGGRGE